MKTAPSKTEALLISSPPVLLLLMLLPLPVPLTPIFLSRQDDAVPGLAPQNAVVIPIVGPPGQIPAECKCRQCGIPRPGRKPLRLLKEKWHGFECAYCFGRRYREGQDVKQLSLTRRAKFETWVAAKLVRKRCKKPKGKVLCVKAEVLRTSPFAMAAFTGQLMRTAKAVEDAGLHDLLAPLRSHMTDLGL